MATTTPHRRAFIGGLLAIGVIPATTWADAGTPTYLAAAAAPDGSFMLCGLGARLDLLFRLPLPARGHAAAAHPVRPEAVAFARRPGTFALIIDCTSGSAKAKLTAPQGRHFYGHGAFSQSGDWLFTTENNVDAGRGCVGVWDTHAGYKRVAEFDSGGIGPHDIKRLPGTDTFAIANGGILTHPDTDRIKLNIPTMQPNLSYVLEGALLETVTLPPEHHKNSIRHLAVNQSGDVALGMQWEGDGTAPPLVARHRRGAPLVLADLSNAALHALNGYIGSIAYAQDGATIATTSPRGSVLDTYRAADMSLTQRVGIADICGIAPAAQGFAFTSGTGASGFLTGRDSTVQPSAALSWDNHLVVI